MANKKRLIDANALNRLLHPIAMDLAKEYGSLGGAVSGVIMHIDNAPTVDAVEVVRCKECAKDGLFTCPICFIENKTLHFINHSPDFYCGEGERKDGDGNG